MNNLNKKATLTIDNDYINKVNDGISNNKFVEDIDTDCLTIKFEDGTYAEITINSNKEEGGETYLNPVLFDKNNQEISYIDCADTYLLNDTFDFYVENPEDEDNMFIYSVLIESNKIDLQTKKLL